MAVPRQDRRRTDQLTRARRTTPTPPVTKAARISALHDLTRKIPSTILADLIGYNRFVVANRADTLAEPWQAYAATASGNRERI